jgi:hypothetical protein
MYFAGSKFSGEYCVVPAELGQLLAHEAIQRQHLERTVGPESGIRDAQKGK